ncbi:MAG: GldG family protein [Ruminococcus sp.]|nr:GldG family protein [Ruminococcus sp.]
MSKKDLKKNASEETVNEKVNDTADKAETKDDFFIDDTKYTIPSGGGMKKFKYGTMSLIIVALVLAIVIIVNLMASMVSKRYPIKFDLTPDKRYELSDESIDVLKNLSGDVDVTVTMEKEMFQSLANYYQQMYAQYGINAEVPYDMIPTLLEKYSLYAEQGKGSINVKYVNIDKDPDVVTKYKQYYNGDIESGSIVVYSNEKVKVISGTDVRNMIQADQASLQSGTPNFVFAGESTLTSAIRNVTDSNSVKVAFITKMNGQPVYNENEYGTTVTALRENLLEKNGYDCEDFDITTDEFTDGDYNMVVLAAPSVDFTENLITKISDFLYNDGKYGKNLIYLPSVNTTNLTNIDALLEDWSLKVENNYIADDKNAIGNTAYIMLNIDNAEAVGTLPNQSLPIIAPVSREITILSKNNEDVTKSILSSYDNSFVTDMVAGTTDMDNRGAHTVVAMSTKEHAEQYDTYRSNLLVVGSALMTDEEFLVQTNTYNNANALLGMINNMTGKAAGTVIPEKSLQQSYIAPTQGQAKGIRLVVQWIIPAIVAVIGAFVLLRRRNK